MTEVFEFTPVQTTQIRNKEAAGLVLCAEHYSNTEGAVSVICDQDQNSAPSTLLYLSSLHYYITRRKVTVLFA
jgi:hypothetical protein